ADRNRSHWSTSKTPSYTKSVSWQHHPEAIPHNPAGVLAILNDKRPLLTIEQICAFASFPQSEDEMNKLFVNSIREMYKIKTAEGKRCIAVMINTVENSVPFNKDL
ncbi:hypothetical protein QMN38_12460, partial [Citrobacter sp. R-1.5.2]|nr:hypothetical protein [Citrobacter sp. R-1.5.2]